MSSAASSHPGDARLRVIDLSEGDPAASEARRLAAMELQLAQAARQPAWFHGLTMLPLLREGDQVQVEPITHRDVRIGDVVTYRFEDKFPTRRVVAVDRARRRFVIMGDSVPGRREYLVPFDDVLARVVRRRRDGAWLATTSFAWRRQTARALCGDYLRRAPWLGLPRTVWRVCRTLLRPAGPA